VKWPRKSAKPFSNWRNEGARHDITKNEIDRMASAFERKDRKEALGG
jgi:hypothetical protein